MIKKILVLAIFFFGCIAHAQYETALDATFDHKDHMELSRGYLRKMKMLPNGKILVMNLSKQERFAYGGNLGPKINLFRLNADLTYDATFTPINLLSSLYQNSNDFDVFSDGKILVAGDYKGTDNVDYYMARFNEDGTPDDSFSFTNTQGITQFNITSIESLKILPNDQVLIGGNFYLQKFSFSAKGLARINYDGTVDMTFIPGNVISQNYGHVTDIDCDSDGNVVVVGSYNNGATFPSYNFLKKRGPNGQAIPAFNITAVEFTVAATLDDRYREVKVAEGNKIYAWIDTHTLQRFLQDGTMDPTFAPLDKVRDFEILPNGNILVSNFQTNNLQIYDSQGVLLTQSTYDESTKPFICAESANGLIITQVVGTNGYMYGNIEPFRVVRYNPDLTLDTSIDKTAYFKSYKVLKTAQDNLLILGHRKNTGMMKHNNGVKLVDYQGNLILNSPFSQWSNATLNEPFGDLNYYNNGLILPDGKIVLSYRFLHASGQNYGEMVRLNSDFTYDMTYQTYSDGSKAMAYQPTTSKLVLGDVALTRYDNEGVFDNEFYQNHFQLIYDVRDIKILPDGKILVADVQGLRRVLENGIIDDTFSGGLYNFSSINTLDVLSDGKIIIGGHIGVVSGRARINPDGTLDATYGTEVLPSSIKQLRSLKAFPDGSALAIYDATPTKSEMIKFDANGNLVPFDIGTGFNGIINSFEIFNDGKIMVTGNFNQYNGEYVNGVARLNGTSEELGISEPSIDRATATVYPNPASNSFQIKSEEIIRKIEIFSLDGKLLESLSFPGETIDVSTLASGYYLSKIYFNSGSVTKKFVKQ